MCKHTGSESFNVDMPPSVVHGSPLDRELREEKDKANLESP